MTLVSLTKEQKHAITNIVKDIRNKQVISLSGYAGTGKTTLVQYITRALDNWAVAAYTGKAADVLRMKGVQDASTIHSLIYVPEKDESGNIALDQYGNPIFILNPDIGVDGIVIDEASMVSDTIYNDLLTFNIPIVFVGDGGQLPPIGQDINLMSTPDYTLETIHRNAGEIAYFAEFIRKGYRPAAYASRATNKIEFISKKQTERYYTEVDQVICGYNKTRVEINTAARHLRGYKGNWPNAGERVMCLRNDKKLGLFNGMQGVVESVSAKPKNKMVFKTGQFSTELFFDPSQFNKVKYDFSFGRDEPHPFDFCEAITAYKAQGSEYDSVLAIEQQCELWEAKRWSYTVASRAKSSLIWAS